MSNCGRLLVAAEWNAFSGGDSWHVRLAHRSAGVFGLASLLYRVSADLHSGDDRRECYERALRSERRQASRFADGGFFYILLRRRLRVRFGDETRDAPFDSAA
jgi:hypothetical protein